MEKRENKCNKLSTYSGRHLDIGKVFLLESFIVLEERSMANVYEQVFINIRRFARCACDIFSILEILVLRSHSFGCKASFHLRIVSFDEPETQKTSDHDENEIYYTNYI